MLFSDLQKRLSFSPIKTWRLLKRLRDDLRMKQGEDWEIRDRKLFVDVPRFIVELEGLGYEDVNSGDITDPDVKSDEIKEVLEELKLISTEITESRIQEEVKSFEIINDVNKPKTSGENSGVKSNEISGDGNKPNFLGERNEVKSDEITLISNEIIKSKDEVIEVLRENVKSKGKDIEHLRGVVDTLSKQNEILTRQNAWLTNLIAAPKGTREPSAADNAVTEDSEGGLEASFTEATDEEGEEGNQEPRRPDDSELQR